MVVICIIKEHSTIRNFRSKAESMKVIYFWAMYVLIEIRYLTIPKEKTGSAISPVMQRERGRSVTKYIWSCVMYFSTLLTAAHVQLLSTKGIYLGILQDSHRQNMQ